MPAGDKYTDLEWPLNSECVGRSKQELAFDEAEQVYHIRINNKDFASLEKLHEAPCESMLCLPSVCGALRRLLVSLYGKANYEQKNAK